MDPLEAVVSKYKSTPHVVDVVIPTDDEIRSFFDAEGEIKTDAGMELRNESLSEAVKRTHHIVILQDVDQLEAIPYHAMTWETAEGEVVAFDVPENLRHEVEGRDDLIWLSDDFALEPVTYDGDAILVMHPTPVGTVGEDQGVKDVIGLFPATPVDSMIRELYRMDPDGKLATCIISFNIV